MSNVLYVNNLEKQIAENEKRYDKFDRMHKEASRQLVEERDELRQQLAAEQANNAKLRDFIAHAQVSSGVCCCGDAMNGHASPMTCGHSPVDMWDCAVSSLLDTKSDDSALREWGARLLEKVANEAPGDSVWKLFSARAENLRSGKWKP